jgi:uncharacterized protein YndB with AHSA1/START domain
MRTEAMDLSVRKSVAVQTDVEHAFRVFTEEIASWWPVETHSIHKQVTPVLEGTVGGRVYERTEDGREEHWAKVLAWEPPHRLVLEWQVNPERRPSEIEVIFSTEGEATRVDLEHRGLEDEEMKGSYYDGWDVVLGRYAGKLSNAAS